MSGNLADLAIEIHLEHCNRYICYGPTTRDYDRAKAALADRKPVDSSTD